jgi:hypothetical protein
MHSAKVKKQCGYFCVFSVTGFLSTEVSHNIYAEVTCMSGDAVCSFDVVTGCEVVPTHTQFCRIETEGQEARNGYGTAMFYSSTVTC